MTKVVAKKQVAMAPIVVPNKVKVSTQTVVLPAESERRSVKKDQAWRYPGGIIQRATHLGPEYRDHHNPLEARRKIESNLFITLNTNKQMRKKSGDMPVHHQAACHRACARAVDKLALDHNICKYLKFGPKNEEYVKDKYNDVIERIEWNPSVEVGEKLNRLHAHIWMTVHHYSQVQINQPVLADMFKKLYNEELAASGVAPTGSATLARLRCNGRPYCHVKLLPQSNWTMAMKQYMEKAQLVNTASELAAAV